VTAAGLPNVTLLRCTGCGMEHAVGVRYHCDACGFPLTVEYEQGGEAPAADPSQPGIWRWHRSLPAVAPQHRVSLGEGGTPTLDAPSTAACIGVRTLGLKVEGANPTGSFKDRPSALGVSLALQTGARTVVVSSTGNAGASVAAYAARAGLRAVVLASATAAPTKLGSVALHGAEIVRVAGTVSDAFALAHDAAQTWGWLNLASTFVNPYLVEANKTVAYELHAELGETVPDVILVPVSVGPLLVGIHRGYAELLRAGLVDRVPRMVAVQAAACAPLVDAFDAAAERVAEWSRSADTIAGGIADPLRGYADDASYALREIRASGGFAIACSEQEILGAQRELAEQEGVFAEPTAAVALAGLSAGVRRGWIGPEDHAVCLLTAHGFKQPPPAPSASAPPIAATLEALQRAVVEEGPVGA
jgi:threonine synthase